eukprot:1090319-Amphidinium_carterae.1
MSWNPSGAAGDDVVPRDAYEAAQWTCSTSADEVIATRLKLIVWAKGLVRDLESAELDRHAKMQPQVARVMQ